MEDSVGTSTSKHTERSTKDLFVSPPPVSSPSLSSEVTGVRSNVDRGNTNNDSDICIHCGDSLCSPTKRCKSMRLTAGAANIGYKWEQTVTDITITVDLSGEQTSTLNVSFTSTQITIQLSGDKSHVIRLYKAIDKDKSRVQLKKQGPITLLLIHVIKQQHEPWQQLEASFEGTPDRGDIGAASLSCLGGVGQRDRENGRDNACHLEDTHQVDDICDTEEENMESEPEITEKEEEPVYNLDHLKNDFFEKGLVLTLQVYIKQVVKDSVKIHFTKQGFVLSFRTEDTKFHQLHENSTDETTFVWPVTTRREIVPEECKFKVKANVIEISLQKTSQERWISLEAPTRKESVDTSRSDTWIPISKTYHSAASQAANSSSSLGATTQAIEQVNAVKSSNVDFDDLSDVNINDRNLKGLAAAGYTQSDGASGSLSAGDFKVRHSASQDWNKPTAKVQPLNSQTSETGNVVAPGFAGLVNLGNTCFMNCVLQVLANTREFRDYFLGGRFQHEINEENPLGMKGQLAAAFGCLLRSLWSCKRACWEPRRLKELIAKKNAQFFGYAQHDAHEFLAFLLDGLHEDLNRIRRKPYTQTVDSDGRPDEVVASEAWAQYKQRNDSVVVDLFQGQYKSKLVCPKCGKVSITFDPFLYLSVPLPKKKKSITVVFMWKESYKRPVRYHIQVPQDSTVEVLLQELSVRTNVRPCDIRIFEAFRGRIRKIFSAGAKLDSIEQKDLIIACEVLSEELAGETVLEIFIMQRTMHPIDYPVRCAFCHKTCGEGASLKRCTKCYKVGYCDHTCQRNHWNLHKAQCSQTPEPVGCPFILSLPCSRATYANLVKHMEAFSRFSVDVFQPPIKSTEGAIKNTTAVTAACTLNNSLSQSSSSLNSLDSLSSASSTCTLTGNQSDPLEVGEECGETVLTEQCDMETNISSSSSSGVMSLSTQPSALTSDNQVFGETVGPSWTGGSDSGFESSELKLAEKMVPMSQVMGVQAAEVDRDKATPTFYIKPVTLEGVGVPGAERLEDRGDQPLELSNRKILSMDWRNNEKQPFYVLVQSKDLEADEANDLNNMAVSGSNKPTLHQCLELFTEPEVLSPEEAWYCPSCKKHVEASKQMTIWRLPHILIIQLKRFSFQNFLMRAKVKKHVDFPTRGLDMSEYCVGLRLDEPPPIYDLYGVVNHHGFLIGGHYTSYVRCCGDSISGADEVGWRLCDDSRVTPIANEKSVVTSDAYLLFYRRRRYHTIVRSVCRDLGSEMITQCSSTDPSTLMDERNGNILSSQNIGGSGLEPVSTLAQVWDNENMNRQNASWEDTQIIYQENISRVGYSKMNLQNVSKVDHENINQQNIYRGKGMTSMESVPLITQLQSEEDDSAEVSEPFIEDDIAEKGDKEKEFFDYDTQKDRDFNYDDEYDNENNDDDTEDTNLIIDMNSDLSYTDMEAVD